MAEKLLMLALSPTMEKGTISRWKKKEGEIINSGEILCEVETDKATMEYESEFQGEILKILKKEGDTAQVGELIAVVGKKGENITSLLSESSLKNGAIDDQSRTPSKKMSSPINPYPDFPTKVNKSTPVNSTERILASPLARRIAQIQGINIAQIQGSGPAGRVIKRDLENFSSDAGSNHRLSGSPVLLKEEKIPISGKRLVIAKRLLQSKMTAPHYYLKTSVVMDKILEIRQEMNAAGHGKISFNAFLIRYVAATLLYHPLLNSAWEEDTIHTSGSVDIGLAVAQSDGLITPVIRNCAQKGIVTIEKEIKTLVEKAQNNRLLPEEYTGATFSISNLGSYGIEEFTAIINPPASSILAVGEIKKTLIVDEQNQTQIKPVMKLTLSCDHRVVDGAVGAKFLKDLKEKLESPLKVILADPIKSIL